MVSVVGGKEWLCDGVVWEKRRLESNMGDSRGVGWVSGGGVGDDEEDLGGVGATLAVRELRDEGVVEERAGLKRRRCWVVEEDMAEISRALVEVWDRVIGVDGVVDADELIPVRRLVFGIYKLARLMDHRNLMQEKVSPRGNAMCGSFEH